MQEETLVLQLQAGDEQALEEIIKQYAKPVHYVIRGILGEHYSQACDELTNDVFYTIWRKSDKIDLSRGSLKALLCTIGRNLALNYLKKHKNKRLETVLEEYETETKEQHGPEGRLLQQEGMQELLTTIAELGEPDSSIFKHRYFYFYPVSDIAEKMNMKREQIDNHLSRGRKKLSALLAKRGEA